MCIYKQNEVVLNGDGRTEKGRCRIFFELVIEYFMLLHLILKTILRGIKNPSPHFMNN